MSAFRLSASYLLVLLALCLSACSTSAAVAQDEQLPPEENNEFDFEDRPGTDGVPTQDGRLNSDVRNEELREGIEGDEVP